MEPWEDELLWDDDFSDEEEVAEEQIEETGLKMDEDSFADWEDASDGAPVDETLEEALAEERTLELESELEQDEHPRDYNAELEDEEEEAAPTSEKRLKREIRAEALRRLEEAARTESDFLTVVDASGISWTGTGSAGNVTMRTCVGMCRWSFRRYLIRRSPRCG